MLVLLSSLSLQVAKFIPRGVVLQYLGAQREIYIESPAAAALSQYMPSPKASESSRVVKSPLLDTWCRWGCTDAGCTHVVVLRHVNAVYCIM